MSNFKKIQYAGISTVIHPCGVVAVAPTIVLGHKVKRFVSHRDAKTGETTKLMVSDRDSITGISPTWQMSVMTQCLAEPENSENWLTRTASHHTHLSNIEPLDNRRTIEHHLTVHGESVYHDDINPNFIRETPPKEAVNLTLLKVGDRVTKNITGNSDHIYTVIGFSKQPDASGEFIHINSSNYWLAYHPSQLTQVLDGGNIYAGTQMELSVLNEPPDGAKPVCARPQQNGWIGCWPKNPELETESRPCNLTVVMHKYAVECESVEGDSWVYFKSSIPPELVGAEATEGERSIWASKLLAEAVGAYWLDRCNGCADTVHDQHVTKDFMEEQFYVYHKSSVRTLGQRSQPIIYGSAKPQTVIQYEISLNHCPQ